MDIREIMDILNEGYLSDYKNERLDKIVDLSKKLEDAWYSFYYAYSSMTKNPAPEGNAKLKHLADSREFKAIYDAIKEFQRKI